MTLVRLAVDKGHQRKGRGQALLEDLKTLRIRGRERPRIDAPIPWPGQAGDRATRVPSNPKVPHLIVFGAEHRDAQSMDVALGGARWLHSIRRFIRTFFRPQICRFLSN